MKNYTLLLRDLDKELERCFQLQEEQSLRERKKYAFLSPNK
jgi:hypothetical protein